MTRNITQSSFGAKRDFRRLLISQSTTPSLSLSLVSKIAMEEEFPTHVYPLPLVVSSSPFMEAAQPSFSIRRHSQSRGTPSQPHGLSLSRVDVSCSRTVYPGGELQLQSCLYTPSRLASSADDSLISVKHCLRSYRKKLKHQGKRISGWYSLCTKLVYEVILVEKGVVVDYSYASLYHAFTSSRGDSHENDHLVTLCLKTEIKMRLSCYTILKLQDLMIFIYSSSL